MTKHEIVPLREEALIEAALHHDTAGSQSAFADGYQRAMIVAARRANSRAVEPHYRDALQRITNLSDLEMRDGDGARAIAKAALSSSVEPKAPDFRALLEEAWKAADGNEGDHVLGSDLNERIKSALNLLAEPKGCQLQNARVCAEWPACVCGRTLGSVVNRQADQMCKHDDGQCHEDDPCEDCPAVNRRGES
jgi:hypothetical protein